MKKAFVILFLLFSVSLFAAVWTDLKDFESYKAVKALAIKAENAADFDAAADYYVQAGNLAEKSATEGIACWQFNNAGFCLIKAYLLSDPKDKSILAKARDILAKAVELDAANQTAKKNLSFCEFWLNP